MANNNSTITTVPLQAQLNLNKNKALISSSFDMLNDCTAPIHGGALSPMYTKQVSAYGIYDKRGDKWTVQNGYVQRNDDTILENGNYFFKDLDFSAFWYPIEQGFVQSVSYAGDSIRVKFAYGYLSDGMVYIGTSTGVFDKITGKIIGYEGTTRTKVGDRYILSFRLVKNWGEGFSSTFTTQKPALITVGQSYSEDSDYESGYTLGDSLSLRVYIIDENNLGLLTATSKQVKDFYLKIPSDHQSGATTYTNKPLSHYQVDGNFSTVTVRPQIIISAPFDTLSYYDTTTYPAVKYCRGITVINKKQTAENAFKNCSYFNTLINCDLEGNWTMSASYHSPIFPMDLDLQPGPRYFRSGIATVSNGKPNFNYQGTDNREMNAMSLGIFCDDSTYVYMAMHYSNSQDAKGSTGEDYWPLVANISPPHTIGNVNNQKAILCDWNKNGTWCLAPYNVGANDFATVYMLDNDSKKFCLMKDVVWSTLVTNQRHHRLVVCGNNTSHTGSFGYWMSFMIDNMSGTRVPFYAGATSTMTIPDGADDDWDEGGNEDSMWSKRFTQSDGIYNSYGSMATVRGTNWRVLFNGKDGYVSGISYATDEDSVGTLISQWETVDEDFFINGDSDILLWKNQRSKTMHATLRIPFSSSSFTRKQLYEMNVIQIFADRYILWNTDAYWNAYDIVNEEKAHWGSDWNHRIIPGVSQTTGLYTPSESEGGNFVVQARARHDYEATKINWIRPVISYLTDWLSEKCEEIYNPNGTIASGVNVAYTTTRNFAPSRTIPYQSYQKIVGADIHAYGAQIPADDYTMNDLVSVYFTGNRTTAPYYLSSVGGKKTDGAYQPANTPILVGTTFPTTSSGNAYYNIPITGVEFINSFSNRFAVKMYDRGYTIQYNGVQPIGMYNSTSIVDDITDFFIIQSQYYAVVNNYICALSYSSTNSISSIEPMVNVNGMKFVGAFPSVAYFYSESARAIYAFTGDLNLSLFCQTDRITSISNYMYGPNNEWIYLFTNDGIYILTQLNTVRLDSIGGDDTHGSVWRGFSTDDGYNIIQFDNGRTYFLGINNEDNSWVRIPAEIKTSYFGPGDMKQEVIDCWYVKFFNREGLSKADIEWRVDTITDELHEGNTNQLTITTDMWDGNNTYTARLQPEKQLAQGASLYVKSPVPITYIGFSHSLDSTVITNTVGGYGASIDSISLEGVSINKV